MNAQWIDSHCHLDAPEFATDRLDVWARAQAKGVATCVMPAVQAKDFEALQTLAQRIGQPYALGIHPLFVPQATEKDLQTLETKVRDALALNPDGQRTDPRLVAVGEIGLDLFVHSLCEPAMLEKQIFFYHAQLKLAKKFKLPVILHVRKSADLLLKGLRQLGSNGGIAHAFNGSFQQAESFVNLGFALGFGGALTFERALQLRRLATDLPLSALVLETDAPDIPPHWLYQTQEQRQSPQGLRQQCRNEPAELAQIGAVLAQLRGLPLQNVADATVQNTLRVIPQLVELMPA
jgi:TatD DNase family protein